MELEAVKTAIQLGQAGVFLWLFLRLDERLEKRDAKHEADIQRIQEQRIQELRLMARIPTNLDGVPPAHAA
jgi:hypothetical protein